MFGSLFVIICGNINVTQSLSICDLHDNIVVFAFSCNSDANYFQLNLQRLPKRKFGALPTENMPKKSHETPKPPRRPTRETVKEVPTSANNKKYGGLGMPSNE